MIPRIISTGIPQMSRQPDRRLRDFGVVESGTTTTARVSAYWRNKALLFYRVLAQQNLAFFAPRTRSDIGWRRAVSRNLKI
jgi:hypothetical protein